MQDDKKTYIPQLGDIVLYHQDATNTFPGIVTGIAPNSETDVYLVLFESGAGGSNYPISQGTGVGQYEMKPINPQLL